MININIQCLQLLYKCQITCIGHKAKAQVNAHRPKVHVFEEESSSLEVTVVLATLVCLFSIARYTKTSLFITKLISNKLLGLMLFVLQFFFRLFSYLDLELSLIKEALVMFILILMRLENDIIHLLS